MRWPQWPFWRETERQGDVDAQRIQLKHLASDEPRPTATSWSSNLNATDWSHYTTTQTIVISAVTTATTLALIRTYKTYIRRIPNVDYLKPGFFRRRSFFGYVTRVGDGDGFHFFHTPGGRWLGWGWAPGRRAADMVKLARKRGQTLVVRIAGVDAPEAAHFGKPGQPFSKEALDQLSASVLGRYVRVYPFTQDQYHRMVSAVYRRRWGFFKQDVGLEMVKQGLATVYEGKVNREFGGKEAEYKAAQEKAKQKQLGMWKHNQSLLGRFWKGRQEADVETPMEFKKRTAQ